MVVIEGRRLKVKKNNEVTMSDLGAESSGKSIRKSSSEAEKNSIKNYKKKKNLHHRIADGFVDAFRPTTPGHSPGVGHSIQN